MMPGTVNAGHIKSEPGEPDRVIAGTAPEIDRPARPDSPAFHETGKHVRWRLDIPRDFLQRYLFVDGIDLRSLHILIRVSDRISAKIRYCMQLSELQTVVQILLRGEVSLIRTGGDFSCLTVRKREAFRNES